jgi:transcriptional antiterminator RfaH
MNWYAIYTKPKVEDNVSEKLRQAGLEVYNPKLRLQKYIRNKYCTVIESLFPCYIFGKFDPIEYRRMISYTRGVRKIVGGLNAPWTLSEEIIELIRSHEKEGFVRIGCDDLKAGDAVKIAEGPFAGLSGIFNKIIKGSERVLILLNALQFQARVIVDRTSLRKVC